MFCSKCGKEINDEAMFCEKCGCQIGREGVEEIDNEELAISDTNKAYKPCLKKSYIASVISAFISLIIRISMQSEYIYYDNLLDNTKVFGIHRDYKASLTLIPGIAAIIVSLVISADKLADKQEKRRVLIVNAVYVLLSIIFIWLDIPSAIFDF